MHYNHGTHQFTMLHNAWTLLDMIQLTHTIISTWAHIIIFLDTRVIQIDIKHTS